MLLAFSSMLIVYFWTLCRLTPSVTNISKYRPIKIYQTFFILTIFLFYFRTVLDGINPSMLIRGIVEHTTQNSYNYGHRKTSPGISTHSPTVHHHHLLHHLPHHLRPLSTVDSGLYSTSDSDHEDNCPNKPHDNSLEGHF